MAGVSTNETSIDTLKNLIGKLSSDEKEKALLLTGKAGHLTIDGFDYLNRSDIITNTEYWREIVFVLQRYDLLKLLHSSWKDVFEQVENRSYFPILRRLLVKIYDAIPESKEREFCNRICKEFAKTGEPIAQSLAQVLLRVESSIHAEDRSVAFTKLRNILEIMDFSGAVRELDRFRECNDTPSSEVNCYPMEKSPCGKCLIINNKIVNGEPEREGSEIDVEQLKETFQNFDFIVECYENLTSKQMDHVLRKTAQEDHSNFSALICCIMSHGKNDIVYGADGIEVRTHEIRMIFCGCQTLIGKPKIFFYQACRGRNFQKGNERLMTDGPANTIQIEDSQKDCLTGMSTVEGNVAFRSPNDGSCFIKSLVKGLNTADTLSTAQILITADLTQLELPLGSQTVSQTPEWVSTLTQDVKFKKRSN